MKHAVSHQLVDKQQHARPAEEAKTQREHAAYEMAEGPRIDSFGVTVVATMLARFAPAFMQSPVPF